MSEKTFTMKHYNGSSYDTLYPKTTMDQVENLSPIIAYPVGSVYLSVENVNPATILGGGTWELIGSKLAVSENVVGNGYGLGLQSLYNDGSTNIGSSGMYSNNLMIDHEGFSTVGSSISIKWNVKDNTIFGLATKTQLGDHPEYSGLIVQTETIYSWKRTA